VRDQAGQVAVFVEHYTVRAGAAAAVDLAGAQDREFVVGPRDGEAEAFVVFVSVYGKRRRVRVDGLGLGIGTGMIEVILEKCRVEGKWLDGLSTTY
jgi:hypothetical protein